MFGWFASKAQKRAEEAHRRMAEARLRSASVLGPHDHPDPGVPYELIQHERQLHEAGIANAMASRARRASYEGRRVQSDLDDLAARFAARTPDEAKAYRFALELLRERGPMEAARIAARVTFYVQMLSRDPQ